MTSHERELAESIEVIRDQLYWVALHAVPRETSHSHFFTIDRELVYQPFFADFGPLDLAMIHNYCRMLESKFKDPSLAGKRIIHYCSHDPKRRANAALLICAYQLIALGKTADAAFEAFSGIYPPFLPFRDATCGVCSFHLTILDCLRGLEKGIEYRWFDWTTFDADTYDFFQKVENGDMNWIVPDKFLAFAGPCPTPMDADGFPAFMPEDYVPIFREAGIGLVVRLNKKQYDKRRFVDHGVKHVDLYFLDGSCPSMEIIAKFMHITESEPSAVAVHCKAGLGRTGTLIGLYAMKHFQMPARAFIGWNRMCRPGSILGPQQQFLVDMQNDMFQAGAALRRPPLFPGMHDAEAGIAQQMQQLSLRGSPQHETYEDKGQGERLCNAKRNPRSLSGALPAAPGIAPHSSRTEGSKLVNDGTSGSSDHLACGPSGYRPTGMSVRSQQQQQQQPQPQPQPPPQVPMAGAQGGMPSRVSLQGMFGR